MTDLHHLAGAYALDALDADERRAFEAHYPGCEICAADVAAHREVAADLASLPAAAPPPEMRSDVLRRIDDTRQVSPIESPVGISPPRWLPLAAAAVLLLAVGALVVAVRQGSDDDIEAEIARLVASPDAELLGLDTDEPGTLTVVWSEAEGRAAVVGTGVVGVADDERYALWLLDDSGARPAGLFAPDDAGAVRTVVDLTGPPGGWGVTVEPASGSPRPTGEILYVAEVTSA